MHNNTHHTIQPHIEKIIEVAICLHRTGKTGASTSEHIAAAFVLNDMAYLPCGYEEVTTAWDRLGADWQQLVRIIRNDYRHRLPPAE